LFALALVVASPALATPLTFAQYFQLNGAQQQWAITNTGATTTITASGNVLFNFSGVSGLPFAGPEDAMFTLTVSSGQLGNCAINCLAGDGFTQQGYTGTFSFIDNSGGFANGMNLLSGTFAITTGSAATTGAQFSSNVGSSGGSFNGSSTAGNLNQLVLTSAYLNFTGQVQENASFSLSSLIPNFAVGAVVADQADPSGTFNAAGSGTFSSNPGPTNATPEPASAFLIGGGLIGLGLLGRKKLVA